MNFESARDIDRKRQELKEARQQYLEKAKVKYERDERKAELAKQRGEESWMLPAVNDRLEREEQNLKKSKKKKKHKKKEKKKKRKESSSSSDSSSDEDGGAQWVEKRAKPKTEVAGSTPPVKGPRLERESWMEAPIDLFPTVTRKDLIDKRNKEKEEMDKAKQLLEKPGVHVKELNPYWKDGGTGLPEERDAKQKEKDRGNHGPGDGGLSWLRKSYERCIEQAKEEGRSVEELAAERWGSLKKIQKMIRDAEASVGRDSRRDRQRDRFMKPDDSRASASTSRSFKRPRSRSRSNSPVRHSYSGQDKSRSKTLDKYSDRHRYSRSRSRERTRRSTSSDRKQRQSRSRSKSREGRHRSRSNERQKRSRSRSREKQRRRVRSRSPDGNRSRSSLSSLKGRFMRPGEMSEASAVGQGQVRKSSANAPAWRKKEFHKPEEDDKTDFDEKRRKDEGRKEHHHRRRSSSSESSSSDSSSEESSSESEAEGQGSSPPQEEVKILSEKELNELGAKILRAEIMGNKEQAEKLKQQLESAREAKKNAPAVPEGGARQRGEAEDDGFVTLTKTDRSGLARPVPDRKHPVEARGGKRRKQKKVETHTGKTGERTKYFDDDDKFDLKTMVEREKLGTAEDQNQMFARLAGRAAEKTNDDFQVDDIFLSKANRQQSESMQEERNRSQAIFEHRKMATALEKCYFCFNNVKKHLIIAIGTKAYLCLPETKSLTEGHCLIVPMQHSPSGTAIDEDVWSEIQVFRKCLIKMFAEKEEDVVFLETSMHLKSFPHMCLHCVPMDREIGELAPIYFKKAIQESESEWSQNKKLVDLRNKDIRRAVPKGFPYFAVDFGYQGGFAHVIEEEHKFPKYFGQEIIGGMIDADHQLWRKPPRENFDDQRKKVLRFAEMWKPHDWTQNITKKTEIDSDSD